MIEKSPNLRRKVNLKKAGKKKTEDLIEDQEDHEDQEEPGLLVEEQE